jgi:hypothetical protein
MQVDDVYCPACRLVLYRRGASDAAPRHCPRCIARRRRLVTMIALDRLTDVEPEPARDSDVDPEPSGDSDVEPER